MTNAELNVKIAEMNALKEEMDKLDAQVEAIKGQLKAELDSKKVDDINTGAWIIRYQLISSNKFDTTACKKAEPDLYNKYLKNSVTTRFTVVTA